MRIVYTDENSRLRDFAEIMNSTQFRNFVNGNLNRISKYDYGMVRVQTNLCKERFNVFLKAEGFLISKKTEHAHGIGNNNMNYVQDINSGEFIGALHLNSDMYSSVYCYATDIHDSRVSNSYRISPNGISLERTAWVPWHEYQFGKEEHALLVINDAIKLGILQEGPNGGVMVFKEFEDGSEGWQEVDLDFAAKDLVKQDMVNALFEKIDSLHNKRGLDRQISSASSRAAEGLFADKTLGKESISER